jgi:hypothetical protein
VLFWVFMKRRSDKFVPGQRLTTTLFTVVDSTNPLSWDEVICDCDCGNRVTLSYAEAYRRKYSCGCKRRTSMNSVDYTDMRVHNEVGNRNYGRSLLVVGRDPETQQWRYLCECCGEIYLMPRGHEHGMERALKNIAGTDCPGFRERYAEMDSTRLMNALHARDTHLGRERRYYISPVRQYILDKLAPYYQPKHVRWGKDWKGRKQVEALYGLPDYPLPAEFIRTYEPVANSKPALDLSDGVPIDPDGFAGEMGPDSY